MPSFLGEREGVVHQGAQRRFETGPARENLGTEQRRLIELLEWAQAVREVCSRWDESLARLQNEQQGVGEMLETAHLVGSEHFQTFAAIVGKVPGLSSFAHVPFLATVLLLFKPGDGTNDLPIMSRGSNQHPKVVEYIRQLDDDQLRVVDGLFAKIESHHIELSRVRKGLV